MTVKPEAPSVLDYHAPRSRKSLKARWAIALTLNVLSGLICVVLSHTIIEALTYRGGENYAKLALVILGVPAFLLQSIFAGYAMILCIREKDEPFSDWDRRLRVIVILFAVLPFIVELALLGYYAN